MKKIALYIALLTVLMGFIACSNDDKDIIVDEGETDEVSLIISPTGNIRTKVVDDDNLLSEETIKNLSVFLTEPSSTTIVAKYIHYNFKTIDDDHKMVILPLKAVEVKQKDIYIVANHDDVDMLNSYTTVSNLKNLPTPQTGNDNPLIPENGFPMFGATMNFDFSISNQATVTLVRTVSKMRIKLTFPDSQYLGTNNSFRIQKAAKYTTISSEGTLAIPDDAYYDYNSDIAFTANSTQEYAATAYLYESGVIPILNLQSFLDNKIQTFSLRLPLPIRNYLYDIEIEIEPDTSGTRSALKSYSPQIRIKSIESSIW